VIEDAASAQHSVTAFLAGIAEGQRQLDMSAPVSRYLGEGCSKADRTLGSAITVRHLMTMTSGQNDSLTYVQPAETVWRLARFGLLILGGGNWNGRDLLRNAGYLDRMLKPSQDLNPSYGFLWWLNGQPRVHRPGKATADPGSLIPAAPADLVAALGAPDRKCYVVPSLGLVVTRLGDQTGAAFDKEFWTRLMKGAPGAHGRSAEAR
jgi:CubicO group peptidase (beta-lactamase class C family)